MRHEYYVAIAYAAMLSVVAAQTSGFDIITSPLEDEVVYAGSNFEIQWEASSAYTGSITLWLLSGSSATNLQDAIEIASKSMA